MLHALCYLAVTRQPAINIDFFLVVAFQAHSHPPVLGRQPLKVFYQSVAFPAGYFFVDMTLVVEQNVFRHVIYFYPWRWCLSVEIFMFLLDLRVLVNNVIVAVQTLFHRRDAREIWVSDVRVTVLALNLFDATVNIVAEGNRLFRAETARRPHPENIDKSCWSQYGDQC